MTTSEPASVVLDTSVLINFLAVDRTDVFARHPGYRFLVTDHVRSEVTAHYREQVERLNAALASGSLTETRVEAIEELTLFARLTSNPRLGTGECAAMAAAVHRNHVLAIDDKTARKAALSIQPTLAILDTQALMVSLIRFNILSCQEADAIKDEWANKHSFVLKVKSFQELL
jgi:predicted nucleic acid-binding protein